MHAHTSIITSTAMEELVKYVSIGVLVCFFTMAASTFCCVQSQEVRGGQPPCGYAGHYNFGDSNSDTGGISAAFLPIQPPNGISFFGKPSGRAGDGRLLVDFIGEHIGLPYLGAYLDTINTDYRHGANFAMGGSTIQKPNESIFQSGISPFSIGIQAIQFTQFKTRTFELYHQAPKMINADRSQLQRPETFPSSLFTIDIGQNDLSVGFRTLSEQQQRAALPDIINEFTASVRLLYQQGARTFWIHNAGPIGCLPAQTMFIRDPKQPGLLDQYGCVKAQNDMAVEFNRQLKDRVIKLRSELPLAALTYVDVYTAKHILISSASSQGFTDPHKICCGRHEGNVHIWCGQRANVKGTEVSGGACPDPSSYISWDGVHYTQAANQRVANLILNGSLSDPPNPVTHGCYKPK